MAILGAAALAWAEAAFPAEETLRSVPLPAREGQGPLDWILRRVPAEDDEWAGEKLNEEIGARLHDLDGVIQDPERRANELGGFLSGEIRDEFPRELERFLSPLLKVEKAKFKIFRVLPGEGAPRTARTDALFEAGGPGAKARFAQVRAEWRLDWREEGGLFKIVRREVLRTESAAMDERPFTEVTEAALGGSASYRDQLRFGLDHWRTRIDAASGIEIYGHQGIAVADVDLDGLEDFYVAQPAGLPNRLYRGRLDGTFQDITVAAGVGVLDETGSPLFFDAESDGDPDLLVVTPLELLLFENDGEARFGRRTKTGLEAADEKRASMIGAAAADYDLDGHLDLYIVSYVFWAGSSSKISSPYPFPYHDANNGAPNFLFRNEGGRRFADVTAASGIDENNRRFSLAAAWCDYDEDGDPDIYVANDFGRNNLYRNDGGRFRDVAVELGVEDTGNGMSVAWTDCDGDGREDLYVGNMWSSAGSRLAAHPGFKRAQKDLAPLYARMAKGNTLFRSLGGGRFEDATEKAGVAFGRWAWSSQFLDADMDGDEDLYVLNGFVSGEKTDDL